MHYLLCEVTAKFYTYSLTYALTSSAVARDETQTAGMPSAQCLGNYSNGISDVSNGPIGTSLRTPICLQPSDIHILHSENKQQQINTSINAQKRKAVINEDNSMLHARVTKGDASVL